MLHFARIVLVGMSVSVLGACTSSVQGGQMDAGTDADASASAGSGGAGHSATIDAAIDGGRQPVDANVDARVDAASSHDASSQPMGTGGASSTDAAIDDDAAEPSDDAAMPSGDTLPIIVAAGANHSIHLSIDEGLTFCQVQRMEPANVGDGYDNAHLFRHITYANGHFVAGSGAKVFASINGYAWDDITDGDGPALNNWVAEIDFGNGYWVGVGGYGGVMRSTDLQHWEALDVGWDPVAARSLAFGDGKFVASRDSAGWWSSTDGSTWTSFDQGKNGGVVFDDGAFIVDPGYRRGRGIRLRAVSGGIERAADSGGAQYTNVASVDDGVADFAFGVAPAEDFAAGQVTPPTLATCLGL